MVMISVRLQTECRPLQSLRVAVKVVVNVVVNQLVARKVLLEKITFASQCE